MNRVGDGIRNELVIAGTNDIVGAANVVRIAVAVVRVTVVLCADVSDHVAICVVIGLL